MRKSINYLLLLLFMSFAQISCSNDDDLESGGNSFLGTYLTYKDVTMKQLVNGLESFSLESRDDLLVHTTTMTFGDKDINWIKPVFQQTFAKYLKIDKSDVVVNDSEGGEFTSYELFLENNTVIISFKADSEGKFNYLRGNSYNITINSRLQPDISFNDLVKLVGTSLSTQSYFYGTSILVNAKSNSINVSLDNVVQGFNVKGDPRNDEYKYKLNVVYFVPTDVVENEFYQYRISEILLRHQLWTMEWMKKWGYEEKSFGLPLLDNGLVDITLIKGAQPQSYYKTAVATEGGGFVRKEITEYFENNNLDFESDHTLVITPINEFVATGGSVSAPTPFYGANKWCFALDYPTMSYDQLKGTGDPDIDKSSGWIGAMLHELGHALNIQHIGASTAEETIYGKPLMGYGSYDYGKKNMFFHEASAATLDNCQVSSFVEKEFYDKITSNVKITSIAVDGDKCVVKGNYTSDKKVTGIIVRFYKSTERNLQNDGNYDSVGFLLKPNSNNTFERAFSVSELENKAFSEFKIGVVALIENGNMVSDAANDKLRINGKVIERITLDRSDWSIKASHALPQDGKIKNAEANLIDGDPLSALYLVKKGKTFGGVSVPSVDQVYVEIDMKKEVEFGKVILSTNAMTPLYKVQEVAFRGSNEDSDTPSGASFKLIKSGLAVDPTQGSVTLDLGANVKYRHIRMVCSKYNASGDYLQFSEIVLEKNVD